MVTYESAKLNMYGLKDISIKSTTKPWLILSIKFPKPPAKIKEKAKYSVFEKFSLKKEVKIYKNNTKQIIKTKMEIQGDKLKLSLFKKLNATP